MGTCMLHEKLRKQNGFTLAETLIVVALIGLMCIVLGGGVIVVRDSSEKMSKTANAQTVMSAVTSRIRTELQAASDPSDYQYTVKTDNSNTNVTICTFVTSSGTMYDGMRIGFRTVNAGTGTPNIEVSYYSHDIVTATDSNGSTTHSVTRMEKTTELLPDKLLSGGLIPQIVTLQYKGSDTYILQVQILDQKDSKTVLADSGVLTIHSAASAAAE